MGAGYGVGGGTGMTASPSRPSPNACGQRKSLEKLIREAAVKGKLTWYAQAIVRRISALARSVITSYS